MFVSGAVPEMQARWTCVMLSSGPGLLVLIYAHARSNNVKVTSEFTQNQTVTWVICQTFHLVHDADLHHPDVSIAYIH